jgi:hypothetical protein
MFFYLNKAQMQQGGERCRNSCEDLGDGTKIPLAPEVQSRQGPGISD